jgi:hypothetical protein
MWANRFLKGTQYARAERHLLSTEIKLAALEAANPGNPDVATASRLLERSRAGLSRGDVEECWHLLNTARRTLAAMDGPGDRIKTAQVLLIEATKLSSWRRKGIVALLDATAPPVPPEPRALEAALLLRDEFYENRYHRLAMQREQLQMLLAIAVLALAVILFVAATTAVPLQDLGTWDVRLLMLVLMFGVIGASFSAARTSTTEAIHTEIPELVQSKAIALTRTVLGACPGLAVYAFLQSKLVDLGDITMAKALALAFVGGFSERLVVKVVESVTGGDEPAK